MLFWYEPGALFTEWLTPHWGNSYGIGVIADISLEAVRKHLRRFLRIRTDDGEQLYFRYYDPRVLSVFLPTCDADQLREFFGPIDQFIVEDPARQRILVFTHQSGHLHIHEQTVGH